LLIEKFIELQNVGKGNPLEENAKALNALGNELTSVTNKLFAGSEKIQVGKSGRLIDRVLSEEDIAKLKEREQFLISQISQFGQVRLGLLRQEEASKKAIKDGALASELNGELNKETELQKIRAAFDPQVQIDKLAMVLGNRLTILQNAKEQELITETKFNELRLNLENKFQQDVLKIQQAFAGNEDRLIKQRAGKIQTGFNNAFASIGQALATGEDPSKAFFAQILNTLGDFAIQYGTLALGIGKTATALASALSNPFTGPAAIPLGLALIALGGALKGAASSIQSGGFETAGGASPADVLPETGLGEDNVSDQIQGRATELNVRVEGALVDPRGTAEAIGELLTDISRSNGIIVNTA
jgi:hypothetical protein